MNPTQQLTAFSLEDIAGDALLQVSPYPVVAPRSVESLALVVQYARSEAKRIMVLGTGSSFADDFRPVSGEIIAVMTYRLNGIQSLSPCVTRILSGTPLSRVFSEPVPAQRKTVGGLVASYTPGRDDALRGLLERLIAVEIVNADAKVARLAAPNSIHSMDPGLANVVFGSQGRIGIITAIEISLSWPLSSAITEGMVSGGTTVAANDPVIARSEVVRTFDPDGLFAW